MSILIDKAELMRHIENEMREWGEEYDALQILGDIEDFPTVDPVKHGHWIDETFKSWGLVHHPFKCNLCGEHAEFSSPYCPSCGAKMDGERKEEC